jgi:hypothetical protein
MENLENKTVVELKAMAYDILISIEEIQRKYNESLQGYQKMLKDIDIQIREKLKPKS